MVNYILIDGSYFMFFRYYAIVQWYKLSKREPPLDSENPINNTTFMDKFISTFQTKMQEIPKRLGLENNVIIVGKDCHRKDIWRTKIYKEYKANRVYDDTFLGGPVFKSVWTNDLFIKGGADKIFYHPKLEADDCLALTTKHILELYPEANIYIITSDMDYLQLASDNVHLYNLKFKKLTESKSSFNDPKKDLFCKILTGDKSDNIPSVFKKCGIKTACKYWDNKDEWNKKLQDENIRATFERNRQIIDFNYIPEDLIKEFKNKNIYIK